MDASEPGEGGARLVTALGACPVPDTSLPGAIESSPPSRASLLGFIVLPDMLINRSSERIHHFYICGK